MWHRQLAILMMGYGRAELEFGFDRADQSMPTESGRWHFVIDEWDEAGESR